MILKQTYPKATKYNEVNTTGKTVNNKVSCPSEVLVSNPRFYSAIALTV